MLRALRAAGDTFDVRVCVTAQHRDLLDPLLAFFGVAPDHDLDLMRPDQSLSDITARMIAAPIHRLSAAAGSIASGALTASVPPVAVRELGALGSAFNAMAAQLRASFQALGASKAALELISLTLANELGDEGIHAVVVDPGDMRTQMHQDAFPGEDISDRPLPDVTLPFWAWLLGQEPSAISGQRFQAQAERWEAAA